MSEPENTHKNSGQILPCGRLNESQSLEPTEEQLELWKRQLKRYLISRHLKYTEQRWKIAELILSTGGHMDAQALVDQVRKKHSNIGSATVYRNIKVLCDACILRESLVDSNGRILYELFDPRHHDHIICLDCGEIFEFHDQKMESLQSAALEKMDFQEVRHRHVVYAHCKFKRSIR